MSRYSTTDIERRLDNLEYPKVVAEALKLVDTRFRAISSQGKKESLTPASCQPSPVGLEPGPSFVTAPSPASADHDSGNRVLSIVVEVYRYSINNDIRRKIESYGPLLDVAEDVKEQISDRNFSDIDFDDTGWGGRGGDVGYGDDDDHDIDNASDFWRRAGD